MPRYTDGSLGRSRTSFRKAFKNNVDPPLGGDGMRAFMNATTYSIGGISALSGISVRRIRFYSDKGLLPPAARTAAGYRIYSKLTWLDWI